MSKIPLLISAVGFGYGIGIVQLVPFEADPAPKTGLRIKIPQQAARTVVELLENLQRGAQAPTRIPLVFEGSDVVHCIPAEPVSLELHAKGASKLHMVLCAGDTCHTMGVLPGLCIAIRFRKALLVEAETFHRFAKPLEEDIAFEPHGSTSAYRPN